MDAQQIAVAAAMLVGARRTNNRIAELPASCRPTTVAEAHAIQDAVAAQLVEPVGAFKAAAPPGDEPWRGLIYLPTIRQSPARIPVAEVPDCGVEAEVAFRFGRDLPARTAPYERPGCRGGRCLRRDRAHHQPVPGSGGPHHAGKAG
jgi:2-keto-4-pentenoate hydratase